MEDKFAVHFIGLLALINDPNMKFEIISADIQETQAEAERLMIRYNAAKNNRLVVETNYGKMVANLDVIPGMRIVKVKREISENK